MNLLRTIWQREIREQIFADNAFITMCLNWDEYVQAGVLDVVIPQAGLPAGYQRNRAVLPAAITRRIDDGIKYTMTDYTIDPRLVTQLEQKQLSYDKLASEVRLMVANLKQGMALDILYAWKPELAASIIQTSGDAKPSTLTGSTGNRKMMTLNDIIDANTLLDNQNVDSEGRMIILPANLYNQVLKDKELKNNFNQSLANQSTGKLGELAGFSVMKRSSVLTIDAAGTIKLPDAPVAATDSQCAFFWHPNYVGRSLGNIDLYVDAVVRPEYYGKTSSGQAQAGGNKVYANQIGVGSILPAAA